MPALTSYTPYETLVFFQNVAQHGADTSSLQDISTTLTQNQLIRESSDYDATKFSPDALQHLYERTVSVLSNDASKVVNGDSSSDNINPLKRKLSTTPPPSLKQDRDQFIQQFVDKLYAQFRSETIKELRQQEREYEELQRQIAQLEVEPKVEQVEQRQQPASIDEPTKQSEPSAVHVDRNDPASAQLQASLEAVNGSKDAQSEIPTDQLAAVSAQNDRAQPSPAPVQRESTPRSGSVSATPLPRASQPPAQPQPTQVPSPSAFNRTLPPPSPQRNSYGPVPPPPHMYAYHQQSQPPPPHMLPPTQALQRMPSHEGYPPHARPPSQGRGSPMPQLPQHPQHPQQPYPQYPPYQPASPHVWPSPGPQQYAQQHYQPSQHYLQHQPHRYSQVHTPNQQPYPAYPNTAPIPYAGQQQWRGPPVPQYHQYPASTNTTPILRSQGRTSVFRSATSTPWKNKNTPINFRPRSPSRLDREISPLSDRESPSPDSPKSADRHSKHDGESIRKLRQRENSATPAVNLSRSQSVLSNTSEAQDPPKRRVGRPPKVKAEPPSTPAPMTSDSEQQQRSSGRRGRPRANVNTGVIENQRATGTTKRKRDAPSSSPVPHARSSSNFQPSGNARGTSQNPDSNFVVVSKNFGKTSQLLLNEISSHKLAGIFAKPLSERDAPGYKSLVLRPQDLKGIKAALTRGSKAAITAIEELESKSLTGETEAGKVDSTSIQTSRTSQPSMSVNGSHSSEGPIGNGFYLVQATEDLVPPKAIVNSSQLETELVRMFANAVMFNPLPNTERGFGRHLRLRKRGGELRRYGARNKRESLDEHDGGAESKTERAQSESTAGAATSESESSSMVSGGDEGGIIADSREMFEDVEKLVSRWRELEGERMGGGMTLQQLQPAISTVVSLGERHASISASSAAGEDANDTEGTPTAAVVGSVRKRRKIGDH